MPEPQIVGVDPGGRSTGIVVRHADKLVHRALIERGAGQPIDDYLELVIDTISQLRTKIIHQTALGPAQLPLTAVEDLRDPNPHLGLTAVRGIIDTAQVIGAIAGRTRIVRIPPGGHGAGPLRAYPDELRGLREKRGQGRYRHLRSAWDIAGAARLAYRQRRAG